MTLSRDSGVCILATHRILIYSSFRPTLHGSSCTYPIVGKNSALTVSIQHLKLFVEYNYGRIPENVVVQALSCVWLFVTPWTAARQASLSFTTSQSLLKLMSIELVMPSNHLILCHSLLLLPPVFPSIRVFSNELALCIRWPNYWSFSISPSKSIQGWFPLGWTGLISLLTKGLSRVFSSTTVQKQQFFSPDLSLWSNSHIHTWQYVLW